MLTLPKIPMHQIYETYQTSYWIEYIKHETCPYIKYKNILVIYIKHSAVSNTLHCIKHSNNSIMCYISNTLLHLIYQCSKDIWIWRVKRFLAPNLSNICMIHNSHIKQFIISISNMLLFYYQTSPYQSISNIFVYLTWKLVYQAYQCIFVLNT